MGSGVYPLAIATRSSKRGPGVCRLPGIENPRGHPDREGPMPGSWLPGSCVMSSGAAAGLPLRVRVKWIKPIERLVPVSFTHCCASTSGLSTWWSPTALKRDLVLRGVSRLDAFSGYPFRT